MKHPMFKFIIALLLVGAFLSAFGQGKMPNMEGAQIVARSPTCKYKDKILPCIVLLKDDKFYAMYGDEKGVLYLVELVEPVLIWERGAV